MDWRKNLVTIILPPIVVMVCGILYMTIRHQQKTSRITHLRSYATDSVTIGMAEVQVLQDIGEPDLRNAFCDGTMEYHIEDRSTNSLMYPHRDYLILMLCEGVVTDVKLISRD